MKQTDISLKGETGGCIAETSGIPVYVTLSADDIEKIQAPLKIEIERLKKQLEEVSRKAEQAWDKAYYS